MAFSMAPACFSPKANRLAATDAFKVEAVRRATFVLGGVMLWSQRDTYGVEHFGFFLGR